MIVGGQNLVDCRPGMVSVGSLITFGTDSKPFREPRIADRDAVMLVSTTGWCPCSLYPKYFMHKLHLFTSNARLIYIFCPITSNARLIYIFCPISTSIN